MVSQLFLAKYIQWQVTTVYQQDPKDNIHWLSRLMCPMIKMLMWWTNIPLSSNCKYPTIRWTGELLDCFSVHCQFCWSTSLWGSELWNSSANWSFLDILGNSSGLFPWHNINNLLISNQQSTGRCMNHFAQLLTHMAITICAAIIGYFLFRALYM